MIAENRQKDFVLRSHQCMSISIINSQVKDFVYVPPREKCVRPTLCPFRVRTHQVLLRTHVCVWERLVGSFKHTFYAIIGNRSLTDEILATLFCLVEQSLNAPLLVPTRSNATYLNALTPNHSCWEALVLFYRRTNEQMSVSTKICSCAQANSDAVSALIVVQKLKFSLKF